MDIVYQGKIYHPSLLPKTADPEGSIRYTDVNIYHEQIECKHDEVHWFDDIKNNNVFIIQDQSPEYKGYEVHMFKGTVLKEKNGQYSWWRNIIKEENN